MFSSLKKQQPKANKYQNRFMNVDYVIKPTCPKNIKKQNFIYQVIYITWKLANSAQDVQFSSSLNNNKGNNNKQNAEKNNIADERQFPIFTIEIIMACKTYNVNKYQKAKLLSKAYLLKQIHMKYLVNLKQILEEGNKIHVSYEFVENRAITEIQELSSDWLQEIYEQIVELGGYLASFGIKAQLDIKRLRIDYTGCLKYFLGLDFFIQQNNEFVLKQSYQTQIKQIFSVFFLGSVLSIHHQQQKRHFVPELRSSTKIRPWIQCESQWYQKSYEDRSTCQERTYRPTENNLDTTPNFQAASQSPFFYQQQYSRQKLTKKRSVSSFSDPSNLTPRTLLQKCFENMSFQSSPGPFRKNQRLYDERSSPNFYQSTRCKTETQNDEEQEPSPENKPQRIKFEKGQVKFVLGQKTNLDALWLQYQAEKAMQRTQKLIGMFKNYPYSS